MLVRVLENFAWVLVVAALLLLAALILFGPALALFGSHATQTVTSVPTQLPGGQP